ncbi:LCP family protein [Clostridium sp.]|uniref:LCP family protein n=1 Tax=Clostridium sp. TaxID=1506 RepID=UPI0026361030|nr:LCP family protein [Clostridium sp.]
MSEGKHIKNDTPKKKSKTKVVILSIFFVLLVGIGLGSYYIYSTLNKMDIKKIAQDDKSLGIDDNKDLFKDGIINIALFGVDSRDHNDIGRSDAIIIATVDTKHNKIKLTSLMRDSYVDVEGHGKTKLTHAYAYGGPTLALKTINQNFGLNVKDYVTVNFDNLAKIIDDIGGVPITIKSYEVNEVNKYVKSVSEIAGTEYKPVHEGEQILNGTQAVGYARVRYVGDGDYERTQRQRNVLDAIIKKLSKLSISEYPETINKLMPYVETNLTPSNVINIVKSVASTGIPPVENMRFPLDGYCKGAMIDGVWYLTFKQPDTKEQIQNYIYKDINPEKK